MRTIVWLLLAFYAAVEALVVWQVAAGGAPVLSGYPDSLWWKIGVVLIIPVSVLISVAIPFAFEGVFRFPAWLNAKRIEWAVRREVRRRYR